MHILMDKPPGMRKPTDIIFLRKFTSEILFFDQIELKNSTEAHKLCCKKLQYEYHEEGRDVCQKGDESDKFYIIIDGRVSVLVASEERIVDQETGEERTVEVEDEIAQLEKGEHFGEVGILKGQTRMANIRCLTDCHFAVLTKMDFLRILSGVQEADMNRKLLFLKSLPLFQYLTSGNLEVLLYNFRKEKFIKN